MARSHRVAWIVIWAFTHQGGIDDGGSGLGEIDPALQQRTGLRAVALDVPQRAELRAHSIDCGDLVLIVPASGRVLLYHHSGCVFRIAGTPAPAHAPRHTK
jgi:hypothetical protein